MQTGSMETGPVTEETRQSARQRLEGAIERQSNQGAEAAHGAADDARAIGDTFRERGRDNSAKLADAAADRVDRVSRYLEGSSGSSLLDDAARYGNRHPMAAAAVGLAMGFAAARFLKAGETDGRSQALTGGRL